MCRCVNHLSGPSSVLKSVSRCAGPSESSPDCSDSCDLHTTPGKQVPALVWTTKRPGFWGHGTDPDLVVQKPGAVVRSLSCAVSLQLQSLVDQRSEVTTKAATADEDPQR